MSQSESEKRKKEEKRREEKRKRMLFVDSIFQSLQRESTNEKTKKGR